MIKRFFDLIFEIFFRVKFLNINFFGFKKQGIYKKAPQLRGFKYYFLLKGGNNLLLTSPKPILILSFWQ